MDLFSAALFGLSLVNPTAQYESITQPQLAPNPKIQIQDIRLGSGESIRVGDRVTIHFSVMTDAGKEIANTQKRGMPFTTQFGVKDHFWAMALEGMKPGSERLVTISSDMAFLNGSAMPIVPPGQILKARIQVIALATAKTTKSTSDGQPVRR